MEIRADSFRVFLKTLDLSESETIAENANDYDVAYNIARIGEFPFPYQKSDAIYFIELAQHKFAEGSEYHFGIHLTGTGLVGACGIKNIDFDNKKAEIGYWLGKRYWGKGYAKEALRLLTYFGFTMLGLNKIYALTFSFNERSVNLLLSLNFKKDGVLRENALQENKFVDEVILSMLKKDYNEEARPELKNVEKK